MANHAALSRPMLSNALNQPQHRLRHLQALLCLVIACFATQSAQAQGPVEDPSALALTTARQGFVFSGTEFPGVEPANPALAEKLLGPFKADVVYIDSDYKPVSTAATAGRYGAIVTFTPESGQPIKRYVTLFRTRRDTGWSNANLNFTVDLPASTGIHEAVEFEETSLISEHMHNAFVRTLKRDPSTAALLAWLYEKQPGKGEAFFVNNAWAADNAWWLKYRLQRDGIKPQSTVAFRGPLELESDEQGPRGPNTLALGRGTPQQAGMSNDVLKAIEEIGFKWADEGGLSYTLCVARKGIAVYYEAYSAAADAPTERNSRYDAGQATQFITAFMIMHLVGREVISLDAPVAEYLPAFQGNDITVADLLNHTTGLGDRWRQTDDPVDIDALVAAFPLNGDAARNATAANYQVLGRIIENVTGEPLSNAYFRLVAQPLGFKATIYQDAGDHAKATGADLAKIALLFLNEGRFIHETDRGASKQRMMSTAHTEALIEALELEGVAEGWFGLVADTGVAVLWHPDTDTIVTLGRSAKGDDFDKYLNALLNAAGK